MRIIYLDQMHSAVQTFGKYKFMINLNNYTSYKFSN